ncbi:MAG: ferredoxin [Solirubrobacteraceae bacterium]
MRVVVDLSRCQGYANCVSTAPDIFDLDEATAQAIVIDSDPGPELQEAARQAVLSCPVQAIILEEDD